MQQVEMLSIIFGCARQVLVWLGLHAEKSELAFAAGRVPGHEHRESLCHNYGRDEIPDIWVKVFQREYWLRTWVVQELLIPRAVEVHCGGDSLDWNDLVSRSGILSVERKVCGLGRDNKVFDGPRLDPTRSTPTEVEMAIGHIRHLCEQRRTLLPSPNGDVGDVYRWEKDLVDLVVQFKHTRCTDFRDKVYALLSLTKENGAIRPDYSRVPADLLLTLCRARTDRRLKLSEMDQIIKGLGLDSVRDCREIVHYLLFDEHLPKPVSCYVYSEIIHTMGRIHNLGNRKRFRISTSDYSAETRQKLYAEASRLSVKLGEMITFSDGSSGSCTNPE